MKRTKKIIKKPDPADKPSDDSDFDEEPTQPIKKGKMKKAIKKPKPQKQAESDELPSSSAKKGKAKGGRKRALLPKQEESDGETTEPPKKNLRVKGKGKITIKSKAPAEESADNSDSDDEAAEKPNTRNSKGKAKKLKQLREASKDSPDDSGSDDESEITKKSLRKVKGKGKKTTKEQDPPIESPENSDSDDETAETRKQNSKNAKGTKKSKRLQRPSKDSSGNSDSDDETTDNPKKSLRKVTGKGKKTIELEPKEETPDDLDSDETTGKPKQSKKEKKKKQVKEEIQEEEEDELGFEDNIWRKKLELSLSEPRKRKVIDHAATLKFFADNLKDDDPGRGAREKKQEIWVAKSLKACYENDSEKKPIEGKIDLYSVPKPGEGIPNVSEAQLSSDEDIEDDDTLYHPDSEENHKECLQNLESIDRDFYKFLKKHDAALLKFDENEDGLEEKEGDDDFEKVHVPGELHGGSDESDFEADEMKPIKGKVTLKMVKQYLFEFEGNKCSLSSIINAAKLFNAAVKRATSEDGSSSGEYIVAGSSVFNAVINLCVVYLPMGIKKYLGITLMARDPHKAKHFVKIKGTLVQYLNDLMKLLEHVTSDNILTVMLKHLHQMGGFVACFTRIAKKAIRRLLPLWSSGEETVRVLAFVCILRISQNQPKLYTIILKAMFMTYVRNSKFVSPTTWPGIHFMRRSLAEMFMLDLNSSYQLVFLYVRQLGIHLRNAIMVPKKDNKLAVYNWQFINSVHLWAVVIQQSVHHPGMKSLHFPMSMIISNTIKLVPTPQYYPLRFHMTEILMDMSRESGLFVPIMGFLVDVLMKFDFNKKHKKASMKPLDFGCLIRVNKSQMSENGFVDAVVDRLYGLMLEFASTLSSSLAFPDMMVILIVYLGDVVNKCNVANHKRKLKQLYDKFKEGSDFMLYKRSTYRLSLINPNDVLGWEAKIRAEGTPLMAFFESWSKLNNMEKRKNYDKNNDLANLMPPKPIKRHIVYNEAESIFKGPLHPVALFPSDSEDEEDHFHKIFTGSKALLKPVVKEKIKKQPVKEKSVAEIPDAPDSGDIVKEFKASDW